MLRRIWKYTSNNALVAGLLAPLILAILGTLWSSAKDSTSAWFWSDSHLIRGGLTLLVLLLLTALAIIVGLVLAWRRERNQVIAAADRVITDLKASTNKAILDQLKEAEATTQALRKFEPEKFELTPPRRRALLVLRHRVDQRTTLHDLYTLVTNDGTHIDRQTTKAQLQHDMEDAERAGIVSIERVGPVTQYYNLAIPAGRDWVLRNERELQKGAGEGMTQKDLRRP